MSERLFIIYDGRARFVDPNECSVLCCAKTLAEARSDIKTMFPDGVIYEYDVLCSRPGQRDELVNGKLVE